MEPVSIVMMVNASLGIARSLVHTINELYELAESYETAALGIRTVATQCSSFKIAIERIHKWLQGQQNDPRSDLDNDFWDALKQNLDTGGMVIDDLNRRIDAYKKTPSKFWTRTKYLWNHGVISELQSQIQGLMSALGLLIHVIDLPNKGVPRSLSRAQSTRLNGLTRSARNRVDAQRRRQLEAAQSGNDDAQRLIDSKHEDVLVTSITRPDFSDSAPPPYTIGEAVSPDATDTNDASALPPVSSPDMSPVLSKVTSAPDPAGDWTLKKSKDRPTWKTMWIRTNKSEKTTKTRKSFLPTGKENTPPTEDTTEAESAVTESSMPITSPDGASSRSNTDHLELQNAVADLNLDEPLAKTESVPLVDAVEVPTGVQSPEALPSPKAGVSTNNPYAAMRLASRSKSQNDFYEQHRKDSADKFNRIRPSQRVLETKRQSPPSSPEQENLSRASSRSRIGDMTLSSAAGLEQSWQTTAITNRAIKIKVVFEKDSFTNKMSASAARVLGVDDAIDIVDGIALANLTLLHAVGSNEVSDDTVVNGEEVEFEVMNEHESRVTELHLGQGLAHLASLMEGGEYIYWNPRSVPDSLRTVDRLRLYRRFELVRW